MIHQHAQDDLVILAALARYSHDFRSAEPGNAQRAWWMAQKIADQHGLDPSEAVLQLESR
ncbi:hypothetical protein AArcMg_1785 [Natrarchaeobaculum sulfurireducens]|uniref:Uncharacterized protein n=1 Tax=Natrarchaeobaculum sulfurireducens TaxID=2044521 RepID=A0A346PQJ8_9EURY|nr:hypothetical protein AArcMg_1785 [Natrarchaeobaculum sulfurireducens]